MSALIELLAKLRDPTLPPCDLTFVAEDAAQFNNEPEVVDALLSLLNHESRVVREGALLGLRGARLTFKVRHAVSALANSDESLAVRQVANELLERRSEHDVAE